jgi:hypothetical protein
MDAGGFIAASTREGAAVRTGRPASQGREFERTPGRQAFQIFPGLMLHRRASFCRYLSNAKLVARMHSFDVSGNNGAAGQD